MFKSEFRRRPDCCDNTVTRATANPNVGSGLGRPRDPVVGSDGDPRSHEKAATILVLPSLVRDLEDAGARVSANISDSVEQRVARANVAPFQTNRW